ncbi:hypothetical protein SO078_27050 (plasmid) [Sinorhizobium meliloti]|uniref:hypothetical protein n=1 Tax=Rhizobium meliloti TaxID=382 RepID=UPI002D77B9C9|nr:hypothetical protein [Sinorhizobium meliloti]WRQ71771.1 hypothetical protein SO078_27050 [Sinorhizobium meliloti]
MHLRTIITAAAVMGMTSGAYAAVVEGSNVCGELPNAKWSWAISYGQPVISGGETSTTIGDITYQGNGNVGKAEVTTITAPTISTATVTCTALNPTGKINADHSTTTTVVETIAPGGTSTLNEVVCNPGGTLPACPL